MYTLVYTSSDTRDNWLKVWSQRPLWSQRPHAPLCSYIGGYCAHACANRCTKQVSPMQVQGYIWFGNTRIVLSMRSEFLNKTVSQHSLQPSVRSGVRLVLYSVCLVLWMTKLNNEYETGSCFTIRMMNKELVPVALFEWWIMTKLNSERGIGSRFTIQKENTEKSWIVI